MANPARSAASVELATVAKRHGARAMARAIEVDESSFREWVKGTSKPRAAAREKLEDKYGLRVALWDAPAPPKAKRAAVSPKLAKDAPPAPRALSSNAMGSASTETTPAVDPHEEAKETVRQLRAAMDRLEKDTSASPRELAQVATSLTSATRVLGKFSGASDLTAAQILRSSEWRKVSTALVDALRPIPGALDAAASALRALEAAP